MALPLGSQVCVSGGGGLTIRVPRQRSGRHQVQQMKGMKVTEKVPIVATMLFGVLMSGAGTVQGRGDHCGKNLPKVSTQLDLCLRRVVLCGFHIALLTSASLSWPTTD